MSNRIPTEIVRESFLTGETHTMIINLDPQDLVRYQNGNDLIQNVFPYLTPSEREFIKTGITDEEWDNM